MPPRRKSESQAARRPPATTPEGREAQLIVLATDLVEKKLRDGTASSQEVTHFLKLGSSREKKEQARIEMDIELAKAKREHMASAARSEDLLKEAIAAFATYSGQEPRNDFDD